MKKYSLISLIVLPLMIGCTANSNFFGNEMIPPSQEMVTSLDSTVKFKTYIITTDSTVSNSLKVGLVGSATDPYVGGTTVGFLCNFSPRLFPPTTNNDELFGKGALADSMFLDLVFEQGSATKGKMVKVSIFEIEGFLINRDSMYFSTFDPTPYYNPNKPLAEVYTDGVDSAHISLPKSFYDRFINEQDNTPGTHNPYQYLEADTLFHKRFNGLYFKTEDITEPNKGAVLVANMLDTEMKLYYKNSTGTDTLVHTYYFYKGEVATPYNSIFLVSSHNYNLANQAIGGVNPAMINNTTTPSAINYVQGLGGLATRAVLDMSSIENFKANALAKAEREGKGTGYKHFAIHRAELRWYVQEKNVEFYTNSLPQLGLYWWNGKGASFIPDYDPILDESLRRDSQFEGGLSRSRGFYVQNITSLMQRLINGSETLNEFNLAPAHKQATLPYRSVIGGSESLTDREPILILTYTLLR